MDPITRQAIAVAAGAGGGDPLYVDDVFSTFLYAGNGGTQSINNGIDISGEGGLVWVKDRDSPRSHVLAGPDLVSLSKTNLASDSNSVAGTETNYVTSFSSNGFSVGNSSSVNNGSDTYVSWTFRKAPGFFDVVTYTGNATAGHTISHSLGSTPGMIIIKSTSNSENWQVWHRSATGNLELDNTGALNTSSVRVNSVTSTSFALTGGFNTSNGNGQTYVAYVFAHDDQSFGTNGDEAVVNCGTFSTDSNGHFGTVNLGFEPQFLLVKSTSVGNWFLIDSMRGLGVSYTVTLRTNDNGTDSLYQGEGYLAPEPNGFKSTLNLLGSSQTFIYMAIRRPNKPPTAGTEVFKPVARSGTGSNASITGVGFAPDSHFSKIRMSGNTYQNLWFDRIRRAGTYIKPAATAQENTSSNIQLSFDQDGVTLGNGNNANGSGLTYINYFFKRVPSFFEVVAYTGTGSLSGVNHNLGVTPELKIIKSRSHTSDWVVGGSALTNLNYGYMYLNSNGAASIGSAYWNSSSSDSATVFSVKNTNSASDYSGRTYVAYLFATLDGISKVGTYSGTGYDVNVDCGFTAGARFIMIKRTDSTGDWYFWDSARGILSGVEPYLLFNTTDSEPSTTPDYIDPLNAGFTVTSSAPAALNASGGTYLFFAIA